MRIALVAAAAGVFAFGQTSSTPAQDTNAGGLSKADREFVTKAAKGGLAEVKLGQLAKERASTPEVKNFAALMVEDHGKANETLKGIAQSKNITLTDSLDPKDQALHDKLAALNGIEFDRAYMNAMSKDHRKDVSQFRKESKSGQDPDIKNFAASTLPTLETHLRMVEASGMAKETSAFTGTQTNTDNTGAAPMPGDINTPNTGRDRPSTSPDRTGASPDRANPNPR